MEKKDSTYCVKCGSLLDDKDQYCGNCGAKVAGKFDLKVLLMAFVVLIFLGGTIGFYFSYNNTRHAPVQKAVEEHNMEEKTITNQSNNSNEAVNSVEPSSTKPINSPEQEIKGLISGYLENMVNAINQHDFTMVEGYLLPGSSLYSDQKNLVELLNKKGITEKLIKSEVIDIPRESSGEEYKVKVYEDYEISYGNGIIKNKSFLWLYTVVYNNGKYYLTNLEKSN